MIGKIRWKENEYGKMIDDIFNIYDDNGELVINGDIFYKYIVDSKNDCFIFNKYHMNNYEKDKVLSKHLKHPYYDNYIHFSIVNYIEKLAKKHSAYSKAAKYSLKYETKYELIMSYLHNNDFFEKNIKHIYNFNQYPNINNFRNIADFVANFEDIINNHIVYPIDVLYDLYTINDIRKRNQKLKVSNITNVNTVSIGFDIYFNFLKFIILDIQGCSYLYNTRNIEPKNIEDLYHILISNNISHNDDFKDNIIDLLKVKFRFSDDIIPSDDSILKSFDMENNQYKTKYNIFYSILDILITPIYKYNNIHYKYKKLSEYFDKNIWSDDVGFLKSPSNKTYFSGDILPYVGNASGFLIYKDDTIYSFNTSNMDILKDLYDCYYNNQNIDRKFSYSNVVIEKVYKDNFDFNFNIDTRTCILNANYNNYIFDTLNNIIENNNKINSGNYNNIIREIKSLQRYAGLQTEVSRLAGEVYELLNNIRDNDSDNTDEFNSYSDGDNPDDDDDNASYTSHPNNDKPDDNDQDDNASYTSHPNNENIDKVRKKIKEEYNKLRKIIGDDNFKKMILNDLYNNDKNENDKNIFDRIGHNNLDPVNRTQYHNNNYYTDEYRKYNNLGEIQHHQFYNMRDRFYDRQDNRPHNHYRPDQLHNNNIQCFNTSATDIAKAFINNEEDNIKRIVDTYRGAYSICGFRNMSTKLLVDFLKHVKIIKKEGQEASLSKWLDTLYKHNKSNHDWVVNTSLQNILDAFIQEYNKRRNDDRLPGLKNLPKYIDVKNLQTGSGCFEDKEKLKNIEKILKYKIENEPFLEIRDLIKDCNHKSPKIIDKIISNNYDKMRKIYDKNPDIRSLYDI